MARAADSDRARREGEFYERAFKERLTGEEQPGFIPREFSQSRARLQGLAAAARLLHMVGGPAGLNRYVKLAGRLHQESDRRHAQLRGSERYQALVHAAGDTDQRQEPCGGTCCPFIALCADKGMTCSMFRAYTNRTFRASAVRVPDQTWNDSFVEYEQDAKSLDKDAPAYLSREEYEAKERDGMLRRWR
jgi:hypothetical protein